MTRFYCYISSRHRQKSAKILKVVLMTAISDHLCPLRKLEQELEQKNQLESHIKIKDSQIMALKGQLVGATKAAPTTPSVS